MGVSPCTEPPMAFHPITGLRCGFAYLVLELPQWLVGNAEASGGAECHPRGTKTGGLINKKNGIFRNKVVIEPRAIGILSTNRIEFWPNDVRVNVSDH